MLKSNFKILKLSKQKNKKHGENLDNTDNFIDNFYKACDIFSDKLQQGKLKLSLNGKMSAEYKFFSEDFRNWFLHYLDKMLEYHNNKTCFKDTHREKAP